MRGKFGPSVQQLLWASTAALTFAVNLNPALAQTRTFNVPAQPASRGIPMFAKQAGIQVVASGSSLRGRRTRLVRGSYTVAEALRLLLEGSGLVASSTGSTSIITIRADTSAADGQTVRPAADSESADIVVTGSRIVGGASASPTINLDAKQMRLAGQAELGEVLRSLPQNFAGGQNPGVMSGTTGSGNGNVSSGSSPNLRGLGGDATLTLMNGHRLSYGARVQAVDVSTIPLAAVDHVDIVADGASAIYGSDAVGGVVNVVLKRNFDGATLVARLGSGPIDWQRAM